MREGVPDNTTGVKEDKEHEPNDSLGSSVETLDMDIDIEEDIFNSSSIDTANFEKDKEEKG